MAAVPEESKVKYNFLGKSGIKVSNICLGAMTFGEHILGTPGQCDESLSHKILDRFVEWGGNFIDTANVYGFGESERILGSWLQRQTRENFVIATKVRFNMNQPGNVNSVGLTRRHITKSIDDSLKRLCTDYVDIYQTHMFDNATPLEETYRTLDDLVRCGKVRYVGLSNVGGWQIQKIVQTQKELGLNPVASLQQQYNLLCRESEWEPFQVCKTEGIAVLPWSPLKGGRLTGKVKRGVKTTEGRVGYMTNSEKLKAWLPASMTNIPDKTYDIVEACEAIGKKHDRSIAQVAIRWTLQKDVVTSPIIGARTLEQLDQNMEVNSWSLTEEEMKQLDDVSAIPDPYPYEMINAANRDRVNKLANDYYVKSV